MTIFYEWLIFNVLLVGLLVANLFFHRKEKKISSKEALLWAGFWVLLALLFAIYVYYSRGREKSIEFLTGYLVEKLLSLDNLFVFLLIFQYFKTPAHILHFVLFWGIIGAIVLRGVFIFLGVTLLQHFHFIIYIFGAFLIYLGFRFAFFSKNEIHPEKNVFIKLFHKFFPISLEYTGHHFFVRKKGKLYATLLLIVLIAVESSDLVFAIDSIPAILAITQDPFIVFTAIIFAILGLRSLYFVLANLMEKFRYFHFAMGAILAIVGVKMIISDYVEIPAYFILLMVCVIVLVFALLSYFFQKKEKGRA